MYISAGVATRKGGTTVLDYDYTYDYLWRLTGAGLPGTDRWAEKDMAYDRNGNIRSLTRYGSDGTWLGAATRPEPPPRPMTDI